MRERETKRSCDGCLWTVPGECQRSRLAGPGWPEARQCLTSRIGDTERRVWGLTGVDTESQLESQTHGILIPFTCSLTN